MEDAKFAIAVDDTGDDSRIILVFETLVRQLDNSSSSIRLLHSAHRKLVDAEAIAATDTKIPLIALCDVGIYNLWIFHNLTELAGLDVSVAIDSVSFADIARIFTEVTGTPAMHKTLTWEEYAPYAEPYPGASVNWALSPDAP
ncbi:hypothetical protein H9Q70_005039 [Fusarium xylarioides]|nr:hypothetical protein H9Q70_005039 [Fusarium xylarioides]KAG5783915.1 hypothetical protein H9Q73_002415 [Fusarium xylarioides]